MHNHKRKCTRCGKLRPVLAFGSPEGSVCLKCAQDRRRDFKLQKKLLRYEKKLEQQELDINPKFYPTPTKETEMNTSNTTIEKTGGNEISVFKNELFGDTRFIMEGKTFRVVAKDVVEKVGNKWNGLRSIQHVPEVWRGVESVSTPSGTQTVQTLSEQGLYFYLGRCDKPAALQYQMWIAGEVVPAIRQDGGYLHVTKQDDDLTIMIKAFDILNTAKEKLEKVLAEVTPKAELADGYLSEGDEISMGDLAKKLNHEGIDIGQNRLFELLRHKGVLISRPGITFNTPTQQYSSRGWFKLIQPPASQLGKWKKQVRVTPKGVFEISKRMHELFGSDL